jgi:hypothetical protein
VFADTGNEPAAVYEHLTKLEEITAAAGVPTYRVSVGDIVARSLLLPDTSRHILARPAGWFASMPLYVQSPPGPCQRCEVTGLITVLGVDADGSPTVEVKTCPRCKGAKWDDGKGMLPRQCTGDYKLAGVKAQARLLLTGSVTGRVRKGVFAETWVGFSTDEIGRVKPSDVQYQRLRFPLLELGMSRKDCERWLRSRGWTDVPKSACVVCPLHGNRMWRLMRNERPEEWAMACAFDRQLRIRSVYTHGRGKLRGLVYLHRSRMPLDEAPINRISRAEGDLMQISMFDALADQLAEDGAADGCGPFGCRSGEPVVAA